MLDGYLLWFNIQSKTKCVLHKRQSYPIFLFKGKKEKELEEKMAVLEQQFLGKIFFFKLWSRLVVSADQRKSEWAKKTLETAEFVRHIS